jgi:3-methylcrotonyl-CoA carboxylase alpha subunit
VERAAGRVRVHHGGLVWDFTIEDPAAAPRVGHGAASELYAPMTGTVVQVLATEGATVEPGAPLLVVEAMKMEHRIVAPMAAKILKLHVRAGERVDVGAILVSLDPGASA